ncbi:carrier protein YMC1 [Aspergillus nomiae NRRL 13137]|uniref:Carrier protein YMC1 n=1 Tax=Aspergillus nomiae NRRL (strain ATCC 15546 / NRRL 13137 / CBS 260.88 / M93) TaxID=1509407 RepID=A0A0L1J576_ASPN3|nr:carrier protein YMC1 [Aspergillus nomiae NRRL 13137]KNG86568.1 carrier protein YMC1 [Aspergillus nomiae NRRL 13137]
MASELKANEPNVAGWRETVTDLTAREQLVVPPSQPFDLVKVRLQTQNGGNAFSTARNIWGQRRAFGMLHRHSYAAVRRWGLRRPSIHPTNPLLAGTSPDSRPGHDVTLSIPQYYLAGAGAGVATSIISGPVEHIHIRLQTQPHGATRIYNGPWGCALKLLRTAGTRGIYRGQAATLLREIHGYGVWFAAYEGFVGIAMGRQQKKREELPRCQIAIRGGLAGEALWLLSHLLDVIKSKMQSDGFGAEEKYRTLRVAFRHTWATGGLVYGLGPALLRAMPVSAGTFATVEVVRKFLG